MTPPTPSNPGKLTYAHVVLFAFIVIACTSDLPRQISVAGTSGLGLLALASCGAVWSAWLLRPVLPPKVLIILLPLILFAIDAAGTLLWYSPAGIDGVQLLIVLLCFLGSIMLSARETAADPQLAVRFRRAMLITSAAPVLIWLTLLATGIVRGEDSNSCRPFALYMIVMAAVLLATWRGYAWPEPPRGQRPTPASRCRSLWPLLWIFIIALTVLLGMSRTGLVVILALIPLSLIYRGSPKSILRGLLMLAIGVGIFATVVMNYKPFYNRFFGEDAHLQVGGVAINSSGRTRIWALLLDNVGDDWLFGKGISSSIDTINNAIPNIGQPHNDYLRFFFDQGAFGLALWLWFIAAFVYRTANNLRQSIRNQSPDYPQHLAALLALTGVSFSMVTDNSYCYSYVMIPLAIVMGCSLGLGRQQAIEPEPEHLEMLAAQD